MQPWAKGDVIWAGISATIHDGLNVVLEIKDGGMGNYWERTLII